ncbi:hypothetical protein DFH08DRAFT_812993 [Mycena albidolilacea]|uniref:EF-hand domain-containing protein n=1 Tax=Mycena albidolilacea TaxID=1033008 RepID=A0AAD6ZTA1_9AGAR|nr:hypothetical protein DFH08DRAFT_812993 [Mycena albidolilacea]
MDARISRADEAMKNATALIKKVADAGLQQVAIVFGTAAELDPRAKAPISFCMNILQLEINRRENDEEIVAVCYSMASMIYVLRYLHKNITPHEELVDGLANDLSNMTTEIEKFGAFTEVYYTKCKMWIVRYIRVNEFTKTLRGFAKNFQSYQEKLEFALVAHMASGQVQISYDLGTIKSSISTLIDRVATPASEREAQALEYVRSHGGTQIVENPAGLTEVAKMLRDSITSSTMQALKGDLDDLIERNSGLFDFKIKGAEMALREAMDRSTEKIMNRIAEGPHDLIDEPDIKQIWKALCRHFTNKFLTTPDGEPHVESWTLKVLRKVVNYPAIGEAVDEDASGFVSVHEINHFLERNKDLSIPVWFAFWAVGPQYLNIMYDARYTLEIIQNMEDLAEKCLSLKTDDPDLDMNIDYYIEVLELVPFITGWYEQDASATGLDELDTDTAQEIIRVSDMLAQKREDDITTGLERIEYHVEESTLPMLAGFRIEQACSKCSTPILLLIIMVLLVLVLRKHYETISAGMQEMTSREFSEEWDTMWRAIDVLVRKFHDRLLSLRRSWRSQKLDINLQVQCYGGGLFNRWYQEYIKPDSLIVQYLEDADLNTKPTTFKPINMEKDLKVDASFTQRVTAIEGRLDTIELMLKQLMSMGIRADGSQQAIQGNPPNDDNSPRSTSGGQNQKTG